MRSRLAGRRDDRGVTLPELLIAIVILSIIIVPLGNALIIYLQNNDETTRRLAESHDVKIISAYFAKDVKNLGIRATTTPFGLQQSVSENDAALGCNASTGPVVKIGWHDHTTATGAPVTVVVNYYRIDVAGGPDQLWRRTCHDGTVQNNFIVVHNLQDGAIPTIACAPSPCNGIGANTPRQITMTLSIHNPATSGPALNVTLVGIRRQT